MSATSGSSWIDEAVAGLESADVYVSPKAGATGDLTEALTAALPADGSIAVVVLPEDADLANSYDLYLVNSIAAEADQDTVILAIGDDLMAATEVDGLDALRIANEHDAVAAGNLQQGLTETVAQIIEETPSSPGAGGGEGFGMLPFVIGGVVVVAGAVTAAGLLARRRRRPAPVVEGGMPDSIRSRVQRLRELRPEYAALGQHPIAAETTAGIDALVSHVEQLFARLSAKAGEDQTTLAEAEYADKLARLVAALDRDYMLDLLTHPELWDDPDERIGEVREALTALSGQILDNIKQVNARKALLFQVSLDSLIGRSELRDWEREFKRSSGE
ncbi:hypothetical protein ACWGJP_06255 [Microbacterium sp. NPDC055903]